MLRDIKDIASTGTLTDQIEQQQVSLRGLNTHLRDIHTYLEMVTDGRLQVNHQISYLLQDIFNLIPNMEKEELVSAMTVKTSDQMLVMYLGSVVRATIALHNLIDNQINNQQLEKEADEGVNSAGEKKKAEKAIAEGVKAKFEKQRKEGGSGKDGCCDDC